MSDLRRVIHERSRLGILSSLAAHPQGLVFNDLKALCNLTDGNLSRQIQLLQEEEFVEVWKGMHRNRPQTLVRLTESGRNVLPRIHRGAGASGIRCRAGRCIRGA